ncbi:M48 family metalloprotease [Streptomyces sp. NPDC057386]|uniref:M48 family metalloprotease n=1 Tax=unclassified Streptomyces TaxID=2593676 RepID=UPI003630D5A8
MSRPTVAPPRPERGAQDLFDKAVPSGTLLRFALLVIAVFSASLEMSDIATAVLFSPDGKGLGCWFVIGDDSAFWREALAGHTPLGEVGRVCLTEPVVGQPYARGFMGAAVVFAVAAVVYRMLPWWRSRRRGLVPVEELDDAFRPAALRAELDALVEQMWADGAWRPVPPRFVVDCGALDAGAVVFGRLNAPVVCLHAGLLVLRDTEPERFRAVVLHELAHIRAHDVGPAYFVLALWRTFVTLILCPYLLVMGGAFTVAALSGRYPGLAEGFWPAAMPEITRQTVKGLLLAAVVMLVRADALRHRELVADHEAVRFGADSAVWEDAAMAESAAERGQGRWGRGRLPRAARLLRSHPSWAQRLRAVRRSFTEDAVLATRWRSSEAGPPPVMYELTLLQFFLIGCTVLITANTVARAWGEHLGVSVVETVASGIVLLAAWHALMRAWLTGRKPSSGLREGLSLGCGLMVGQLAAGIGTTSRWWPSDSAPVLTLLVLPAVSVLWTTWIMQSGHLSLLQGNRPASTLLALTLPGWVLGLMLIGWWQTTGYAALAGHPTASPLAVFAREMPDLLHAHPATARVIAWAGQYLDSPVNGEGWAITGTMLWAFPVLVQLPRVFGDVTRRTRTRTLMHQEGVTFRGVARAGIAGGLLATAGILCTLLPGGALSPDPRLTDEARLMLTVWWSAAFVWGGALTAAVLTALRPSPVWVSRAAVAAAVAHSAGLLGFVSAAYLGGCGDSAHGTAQPGCGTLPHQLWRSLPTLISLATMSTVGAVLAAALLTLAIHGIRRAVRRTAGPAAPVRPSPATRSRLKQAAVAALLAVTVGSCTASQEIAKSYDSFTELLDARSLSEPVPSLSTADRTRALQTLAWNRAAGNGVMDVVAAHNAVHRHLDSTSPDIESLHAACSRLRTQAERALSARPFPQPDLRRRWTATLRATTSAATTCLTWPRAPEASTPSNLTETRTATLTLVEEFQLQVLDAERYWK